MSLQLSAEERAQLWREVIRRVEEYAMNVDTLPVSPVLDPEKLRAALAAVDFVEPVTPVEAVDFAADQLTANQVHTPHSRYFGLFNPKPTTMGIAADTLVAAFNPQIAAWSHNPFAAEAEVHLARALGERFGYRRDDVDGVFTSGGMEANHTAVLTALTSAFPEFSGHGVRGLAAQPVLYCSAEAHHSFLKAAMMCGLGLDSVHHVTVDTDLRMRSDALVQMIASDRANGFAPFMIAATAGTTNAGAVDPIAELAGIAERERLWFHVDAAWGGAAAFVPELRRLLNGIEKADSITFDAHKWLSVPMGAGLYLTRHRDILSRTFRVATAYMPREAAHLDIVDPHLHSMQWSRRFIGLKLLLSLMVAGWSGYESAIRHQTDMGQMLRSRLEERGWKIENKTDLPVVCFSDPEASAEVHHAIAMRVVGSGEAWISTTILGGTRSVLRACITNYDTQASDVEALVEIVGRARDAEMMAAEA